MKRERILIVLLVVLLLAACSSKPAPASTGTGPGRMIRRMEIAIHPADEDFERVYETQENMTELLNLLRSMETEVRPETEPDINDGQVLYTATITFANGEQSVYYLLGHTYLRLGDNPWCVVDTDLSLKFSRFIREHPSDDGDPVVPTTAAHSPSEQT